MGKITVMGMAGPHHPMYGICRENVAPALTKKNWRTKAVWRQHEMGGLYVFVARGVTESDSGEDTERYYVKIKIHGGADLAGRFDNDFATLEEALAYANGQDEGLLAKETQPASLETLPERPAPLLVSFVRKPAPKSDQT